MHGQFEAMRRARDAAKDAAWCLRRADGSWRDSVYFSVLRDEWPDVRSRLEGRLRRG